MRAANPPMLTWSSLLPDVEIESTLEGWASTLFSLTSPAAVQCAIMKPESRPGSCARKAGSPEMVGFISRSMRRSLMLASSDTPIAK